MNTGYCYDPLFLEHTLRGHPESSERLERIWEQLAEEGLLDRMSRIQAEDASLDLLAQVHDRELIAWVKLVAERGGGHLDPDTYVAPRSYDAALRAAGSTVTLVRAVLEGRIENGIALVRPPGHHATPTRSMGFCLFNNIAAAAQWALTEGGLKRVLIVDWDVHHGNGTQAIFYDRADVLFFSTHQYPHYPGTGHWRENGSGPGEGYTINVPLASGIGDMGFRRVREELLMPVARRYRPELILVSAGYDAHWDDPLAGLRLSLHGYSAWTQDVVAMAEELCRGRLVVVLEGGYNLPVLAHGVAATCTILLGDPPPPDPFGPSPYTERPLGPEWDAVKRLHLGDPAS